VSALDASVLVAHLRPADAHHSAATELLRDALDEDLVAHAITIAEVLVGGVRINPGEEMLTDLRAIGVEVAPLADDEPLRLAHLRAATGLRMPGCCVLATALNTNASLATFDKALAAAAREREVGIHPTSRRS